MIRSVESAIVKFNIFALQKRLELLRGEAVTQEDIAAGSGLHINTIYGMFKNTSKRVDLRTMERLIAFFNDAGLEIEAGDLFTTQLTEENEQIEVS